MNIQTYPGEHEWENRREGFDENIEDFQRTLDFE